MKITLPYAGIVLLIGPSNSGKSTFIQRLIEENKIHASEVVSSDDFRVLVSDTDFIDWKQRPKDEADNLYDQYQIISREAFSMMDLLIEKRCKLNKLTFVDATHLHADDRKRYIEIARNNHVPIVAVAFDVNQETLLERDDLREKPRGKRRIRQQFQTFKREKRFIKKEGYMASFFISGTNDIEIIRRTNNPLELDVANGIDVIGDIHGCYDEFIQLLEKLGYEKNERDLYVHPEGRKILSLGDIMSRGPHSLKTIQFFLRHVQASLGFMIDSNHGWKIARWLDGRKVTLNHGDELVEEEFNKFEQEHGEEKTKELKQEIKEFLFHAPSHYVLLKNGVPTAVCTHAGIKDEFIGKQSHLVSDFCRYGDTDGVDESGKPIRKDWTISHRTSQLIIWGHDPRPKPIITNNTINIDQGVVFGGELSAFRYPEKTFVSIKAKEDYSNDSRNPLKEWEKNRLNPPNIGKYINGFSVLSEELGEIHVPKKHVLPAIDLVSHHTVPMEELVYIPPTMSPSPKPSALDTYLEHPKEVIDYYLSMGVEKMVAEKKHMGSRGILLIFKDTDTALQAIGRNTLGTIYTRTGRKFFDEETEKEILTKLNQSLIANDYFSKYNTEYVLLDAEIMPWNLKAKELISNQYAHVSENAILDRATLKNKLETAARTNQDVIDWLAEYESKLENAYVFQEVFQKYCWNVDGINEIQIAPFHVLAHSKETFFHKPHTWHMEMNREFAAMDDIFVETEFKVIEDSRSEEAVIKWWEEMTADGHEGIVIKPLNFISRYKGKLVQPAIKVRGRKYLHIIYGMDYLLPENLKRLKERNVGKKQKLALKEFALGVEGIKRFVNREQLERVHECVLGTLAMESDPVDPRL
ncbi:polynucleotide kinase-phosphatase [Ornithinibacillus halotolerans]|uniref:Polynucleotide kinase-phosphatase n=1 Tax=Ornithinibacillus halotolerans TaxID=1274357 RepID=A0A916WCJ7_9BACI|nr:polynucleotide kinase-phosphatase [Ornithinibacillus halotolerans]GGA88655.1 polynucleotide kinase-phosphatase [Ornithinibacillus halotolerans]